MSGQFFKALQSEKPLQITGVINALGALLAQDVGFKALYLSGAGVANGAFGLPDVGLTTYDQVCEEVRRIHAVVKLPLLVDADTGFGNSMQVKRSIKALCEAGASAIHIEDQVVEKRCGHLPSKKLVEIDEMVERIHAALEGTNGYDCLIMARSDANGEELIARLLAYKKAGAQLIFPEALSSLEEYKKVKEVVNLPTLANLTEFGKTPLFSVEELKKANIDMALYPLSAFRAMNQAAKAVYSEIRVQGTQKGLLEHMQSREDLYKLLKYDQKRNPPW